MREPQSVRRLLSAIALAVGLGVALLAIALAADLPPAPEVGHQPLRDHPPGPVPDPQPPAGFTGYPDAPEVAVLSRQDVLKHYPCADCHAHMPSNTERRALSAPHPGALNHGDGRFWCLDCHDTGSRNELSLLSGDTVGFDQADEVCAQCHGATHRDWTFGAHGKRVENWQGERGIYSCAHCHNPHDPAVRPRAPEGPPGIRAGLERMPDKGRKHPRVYPWQPAEEESGHE